MNETNRRQGESAGNLPITKNEDVEYETEFADADDLEAVDRAHEADARQENA